MKRTIALMLAFIMIGATVSMAAPPAEQPQDPAVQQEIAAENADAPQDTAETQEAGPAQDTAAPQDPFQAAIGRSIISKLTGPLPGSIIDYLMRPSIEHLSVGNPNPLRGQFFTDLWGNSTSDQDVRELLHAYNLVRWDGEQGMFDYDPTVVSNLVVTENTAGDRTYTFTLQNDLVYSDSTPITAWDYAFSMLLQISPEISAIGATAATKPQILGYQAYMDGTAAYLAGIRVTDDYTIAITIDNTYLPFFYEMALVSLQPYPISVIAPGVAVRDAGQGVYLANIDETVTEPVFTADLIRRTILDPQTGYQSHPSVVSGPYVLESWDGQTAEFEINENYKGNVDGQVPTVRSLSFSMTDNATMIDELRSGKYDLLNKVMNRDTISAGMALVNSPNLGDYYGMSNYPRSGLGYIAFACEKPALSEVEVRQALAWCMNRQQVMTDYVDYYGILANGYYGVGQWLYGVVNGTLLPPVEEPDENDPASVAEYERTMEEYEALSLDGLTDYEVDIRRAQNLLDRAGWTLNEEGIRQKTLILNAADLDPRTAAAADVKEDGTVEQTVTLEFKLAYAKGNTIADSFMENFVKNLEQVGIKMELVPLEFSDLLNQFYYPQNRTADMFFLATNFDVAFDPSAYFVTETDPVTGEETHTWVTTGCSDEQLYEAAVAMRETEPGDVLTYMKHWIEFQERFNEVLPMLPIYSNIYFDFYTSYLTDYNIVENTSWADAIITSHVNESLETKAEQPEADAEGEAGAAADGTVEFDD